MTHGLAPKALIERLDDVPAANELNGRNAVCPIGQAARWTASSV
jgi:hypothetical protein